MSTPDESGSAPKVTQEEIDQAMAVNSTPDETRTHADADETERVVGGDGQMRSAEDGSPTQD